MLTEAQTEHELIDLDAPRPPSCPRAPAVRLPSSQLITPRLQPPHRDPVDPQPSRAIRLIAIWPAASSRAHRLPRRALQASHDPARRYRDSFISIVDDPFFQRFDPAFDADVPPRPPISSDSEDNSEDDDNEEGHDVHGRSEYNLDEEAQDPVSHPSGVGNVPTANKDWPPPRRESLTIGPSQYWVSPSLTTPRGTSMRCRWARASP
jgi:hypothetical protein